MRVNPKSNDWIVFTIQTPLYSSPGRISGSVQVFLVKHSDVNDAREERM